MIIIYGLITLGILVFVHELGHFIAGKSVGIRVEEFSVGFGRGLFSFDRKGTHYKIGWMPIGGYCKFAGEGDTLKNERQGEPDEFYERPAWARLITVAAGVFFNFVFAIFIFFFVSLLGYSYTSSDNKVTVFDKSYKLSGEDYAYQAGLRTGDRIVSIDGVTVKNFREISQNIIEKPEQVLKLGVIRKSGKKVVLAVTTGLKSIGAAYIGIAPYYATEIDQVLEGTPASKVGMKKGDIIISLNGKPIDSFYKLKVELNSYRDKTFNIMLDKFMKSRKISLTGMYALLLSSEKDISVKVLRDNKKVSLRVNPFYEDGEYRLGFMVTPYKQKSYQAKTRSIFGAVGNGFSMFGKSIGRMVSSIGLLFNKKVDKGKALAGPLRIIQFSGEVMQKSSISEWLLFLAMISIALGFFNILPIPAADGGHIVLTIIEMIRRKKFSFAVLQRIQLVGILFLSSLFFFVLFFDLKNLL